MFGFSQNTGCITVTSGLSFKISKSLSIISFGHLALFLVSWLKFKPEIQAMVRYTIQGMVTNPSSVDFWCYLVMQLHKSIWSLSALPAQECSWWLDGALWQCVTSGCLNSSLSFIWSGGRTEMLTATCSLSHYFWKILKIKFTVCLFQMAEGQDVRIKL